MNTNSPWAFVLTAAFPTIAALVGIIVSNGRFNDLSKRMDDLSANMVQHRNQIHSDIQMLIGGTGNAISDRFSS